jgi:HEPN domain-containing protein
MLNRSRVSLKKSKDALETYEICNGEEWLDSACYDAQQSLEFLIKGILLEYGKTFERSHDIGYLAGLLEETAFKFEKLDALIMLASTITSWEEGSRYGQGIKTTVNTVRRVHNIYIDMLETFLEQQSANQK